MTAPLRLPYIRSEHREAVKFDLGLQHLFTVSISTSATGSIILAIYTLNTITMSNSPKPYATRGLPPPPAVSMRTIPMAGLLVDVYGLDELPSPSIPITCLWLLHPRTRERSRMSDIAARTIAAWNGQQGSSSSRRREIGRAHV